MRPTRIRDIIMIPGPPELLKCPFCGDEKKVLTLLTGNTLQGQQWSDTRSFYPMFPQVSPIQKCPSCGKYYFTKDAKRRLSNEVDDIFTETGAPTYDICTETGALTYEELKMAAIQFGEKLRKRDKRTLDLLLLWAYNDKFNRENMMITVAPREDQEYVNSVLDELLTIGNTNKIVKAEYLRELGRYDDAIALLDKCHPKKDFQVKIVERMKSYAKENNPIAFKI